MTDNKEFMDSVVDSIMEDDAFAAFLMYTAADALEYYDREFTMEERVIFEQGLAVGLKMGMSMPDNGQFRNLSA